MLRLNPVILLFVRVFCWLPICLGIWYFLTPLINWPLAVMTNGIMSLMLPEVISSIEPFGPHLDVVTKLPLPSLTPQMPLAVGDVVFTLNPLVYGYGIPFYSALVIAVPDKEVVKWRRWCLGLPWLLVAQSWGVIFDILHTLLFSMGPDITIMMNFTPLQMELTALGYQLGSLILPPVLPMALWVVQHRGYLGNMVYNKAVSSE